MLIKEKPLEEPLRVIYFRENFLENLKFFRFEKILWSTLEKEVESDQSLKDEVFEIALNFLNYDREEFDNLLIGKWSFENKDIQHLVVEQYERLKFLFISFIFDQLPYNYLIKISKKQGKYNLKENFRENLIEQLNIEIQRLTVLDSTLGLLQEQMPETKKKNDLLVATSKLANSYEKIIIENKLLIGMVNELTQETIDNLIDKYIDNSKVFSNLY